MATPVLKEFEEYIQEAETASVATLKKLWFLILYEMEVSLTRLQQERY